jgi:hypothetical protein
VCGIVVAAFMVAACGSGSEDPSSSTMSADVSDVETLQASAEDGMDADEKASWWRNRRWAQAPAPAPEPAPAPAPSPAPAPAPSSDAGADPDVVVDDGSSVSVEATAAGTIYYTSTSGSDSNAGTQSRPFRTISNAVRKLKPGDTLLVGPGVYAESSYLTIPSGSSWQAPVTIKALDPNNRPVMRPSSSAVRVLDFMNQQYIVVDGFVLDASSVQYDAVKFSAGARYIRLKNSEVRGAPQQGIMISGASNLELLNLDVHDNGTSDFTHGIYVSGSYVTIDGSRIYRNAGWGVQVYAEGSTSLRDNVVRNSHVYDNARVGGRGVGIILSSGSGHKAYNNVVRGNNVGISVNYGASNVAVFNNTVVGNRGEYAIYVGQSQNASVRNNIVWQNSGNQILNQGSGTVLSKNLVGADPKFMSGGDFRLQTGSPAVDTGDATGIASTDILGAKRPTGAGPDIGAYESH